MNGIASPHATIRTVGILGSGIMGAGLVEVTARAGYQVIARSRSQASADALIRTLEKALVRHVERQKLTADEADAILSRVTPTADVEKLGGCDLVIESVVEDLEVKRELFAAVSEVVEPHAILTTNTSTLPVIEMAMATRHPERVCGAHFFNPAPAMRLVEIVRPITAADTTVSDVVAFAESCGKDAIHVADRAGFVVNALLFPYLNNAIKMLERGTATMEDIDSAMKGGCNFPMGPFALLDLVGLDTTLSILDALYDEFRDPNYAAAPTLRRMVSAGWFGRKTGRGFYQY